MKESSVLIVNDNPTLADALKRQFESDARFISVVAVYDAKSALEYLDEHGDPNVALIDILMPVCDGIELVSLIREKGKCNDTVIIGLTGFLSDSTVKLIQSLGIAYIIAMPSKPEAICNRVCSILNTQTGEQDEATLVEVKRKRANEMNDIITRYIFAVGVSAQHDGFRYMRDAAAYYVEHPDMSIGITTDVYPMIAKKYNITEKIVERSIRYAIEMAWLRGNVDNQYRLFGYTVKEDKGRPTNKECITLIAERTRVRLNGLT